MPEATIEEQAVCKHCGIACSIESATEVDGDHYCAECLGALFALCYDCAEYVPRADATRIGRNWVCESCRDEHYFICDDCSEWTARDYSGGENTSGNAICSSCGESYFTCNRCEGVFHNDDYGSDGNCRDCSESGIIQAYSTECEIGPIGKGPHYFGVELEVESKVGGRADLAERVSDKTESWAILKEDGSLSNGFEIVTAPMSLEEHRERWTKLIESNGLRGLISWDTTTCGMHVHCSREPLTDLTVAKIVCFVNSQANRDFVERIAGRKSCKWAEYKPKALGGAYKYNPERREAVNLQHPGTIEFRIFKGTTKLESILKNIEFCDAIIKFCLPASRSLQDSISLDKFNEFVEKERKAWPRLHKFLFGETQPEAKGY